MVKETQTKPKRKATGAAAMGAGPGRPKGVPNKTTTELKQAILNAANDGARMEKERRAGWLPAHACKEEPKAFSSLLGPRAAAPGDG